MAGQHFCIIDSVVVIPRENRLSEPSLVCLMAYQSSWVI